MKTQAPSGKFRVVCTGKAFGLTEHLLVGDRDTEKEAMALADEHLSRSGCVTVYDDDGECIGGGLAHFDVPPCPRTHEGDLTFRRIQ